MAPPRSSRVLRWLEALLVLVAGLTFGIAGIDFVRAELDSAAARQALSDAAAPRAVTSVSAAPRAVTSVPAAPGDEGDGPREPYPGRPATVPARVLVGELEIPRVNLSTLVFDVRDPATLRHAAGHLRGTSLPWQDGNSAVAGHRDSAFRQLRHVRPGDDIRFVTVHGTFEYQVTRAFVVYPEEVEVLDDEAAALTLITCFPFRWVGSAPERWIVHAKRVSP